MEPFEWLLLGAGLAVGALLGSNSKSVMRTAARGYLVVDEKAREWAGNMREDFQDAIEEARYEREEADDEASLEEEPRRTRGAARRITSGSRSRRGGDSDAGHNSRRRSGAQSEQSSHAPASESA